MKNHVLSSLVFVFFFGFVAAAWEGYTFEDGVLTVDGETDLKGKSLTFERIASMTGTGSFTDSVGGGVLTFDVDEKATIANGKEACLVQFTGGLKIVKTGAGTLSIANSAKGGVATHSFTGGLEVRGGTLKSDKYGKIADTETPFGSDPVVDVYPEATLDLNGCYDLSAMTINLRGGTLKNGRTVTNEDFLFKATLNVYEESTFSTDKDKVFNYAGNLKLNGNTLNLSFGSTFYWHPESAENGTIKTTKGSFLVSADTDMKTVTLDSNVAMELKGNCSVRDYLANYDGDNSGTGTLSVYGKFVPNQEKFYPPTMMNGSTIDLSGKTETWNGSAVTFADGAMVTIALGDRVLEANQKIVSWDAKPEGVTFGFTGTGIEETEFSVTEVGIVYRAVSEGIAVAMWIGGESDDWGASTNWDCRNARGERLADAVPDETMTVVVTGDVSALKLSSDFPFAGVRFLNAYLSTSPDWSGFDFGRVTEDSLLDTKGVALELTTWGTSSVTPLTITNTSEPEGLLTVNVPEGVLFTNDTLSVSGNLKFVKTGLGTLVAERYPQTYAGETVVEEGALRAADNSNVNATEKGSPFGALRTITVSAAGVLDPRGSYNWSDYTIVLNGGMISNTVANIGTNNDNTQYNVSSANVNRRFNPNVTLLEDSTFATTKTYTFFATVDSNGYELQNWIAADAEVRWQPKTKTGGKPLTMDITGGGKLFILKAFSLDQPTMTLKMSDGWVTMGGDMVVSNYVAASKLDSFDYKNTNAVMKVWGTFTPETQNFIGCTLQDGSNIDLSKQNGVWNSRGYTKLNKDGKNTVKGDIDFADGATVTIDVGDREFKGVERVVVWSEGSKTSAAGATFVLNAAAKAKGYCLTRDANGLSVGRKGFALLFQ